MTVFNPEDTTHIIKIVPRYYPEGDVIIELSNEEKSEIITETVVPVISDGYLSIQINHTFTDNSNYRVKISKAENIVYRGKLFVTNQSDNTQDYQISKDVFRYE